MPRGKKQKTEAQKMAQRARSEKNKQRRWAKNHKTPHGKFDSYEKEAEHNRQLSTNRRRSRG